MISVVVHPTEHNSKSTNSMHASDFQNIKNFLKYLVGRFSFDSEARVNVGVVTRAFQSKECRKLFVVKLAVSALIVLLEKTKSIGLVQHAPESL